jgi:hypothetical protein
MRRRGQHAQGQVESLRLELSEVALEEQAEPVGAR